VKWADACAVLLRTAALSLTPDAAGAAHPRNGPNVLDATAGVPRSGEGPDRGPFDLRGRRTCLSGAATAAVTSGERAAALCIDAVKETKKRADFFVIFATLLVND